jgi:hypothetical protein
MNKESWWIPFSFFSCESALQLAEVAVPRELFRKILSLIDDLRPRPAPALAGDIDGVVKTTGGVCLNGGKSG